jgi:hypothetical protein
MRSFDDGTSFFWFVRFKRTCLKCIASCNRALGRFENCARFPMAFIIDV